MSQNYLYNSCTPLPTPINPNLNRQVGVVIEPPRTFYDGTQHCETYYQRPALWNGGNKFKSTSSTIKDDLEKALLSNIEEIDNLIAQVEHHLNVQTKSHNDFIASPPDFSAYANS